MRLFFIGSDAGKIGSVLFCIQLGAHAAQAAVQVPPDQRFNGIQVFFPDHPQNFPVLAQPIRHLVGPHPVSYTQLDVYKRQAGRTTPCVWPST